MMSDHSERAPRSIPSLDGLRTISVVLVLVSHFARGYYLPPLGFLGVRTFFVISGYLITALLASEVDSRGTIQIGRFYFRRTLRIFPVYYVMLGATALLGIAPRAHWSWLVGYAGNLGPSQPDVVAHAWSLGVEEQFYLLWPTVMLGGRARAKSVAWAVILLLPVARLVAFAIAHTGRLAFATPDDFLAAGCLLALSEWRAPRTRFIVALIPLLVAYHLFFAESFRWRFVLDLIAGQGLCALAIAAVIAWCIEHKPIALNLRSMRLIGVLSYSIYIWHLLVRALVPNTALALPLVFATAAASYFLIERPFLAIREYRGRALINVLRRTVPNLRVGHRDVHNSSSAIASETPPPQHEA